MDFGHLVDGTEASQYTASVSVSSLIRCRSKIYQQTCFS